MLEAYLEQAFRKMVKEAGGVIFKLDANARKGAPDRVVTLPGRPTTYVELKTEHGRLSPIQKHEIESIISAGGQVRVLYGIRAIREFVNGPA